MKYRVPIRLHKATAKTKAEIFYVQRWEGGNVYSVHPAPGASIVEFEANSHVEAARKLQALVEPGDDREIQGRSNISYWMERTS